MRQRATGQVSFADMAVAHLGGPRAARLLASLDAAVPWKQLVALVQKLPEYAKYIEDPSRPGERPIDPLVMLKALMLQKWYNLSDPQLEDLLLDRISFRRFVGLSQQDPTPDETTFVKFRRRLREAQLDQTIFDTILKHIQKQGLLVKQGTIVDATIIQQAVGQKTRQKDADGNALTTRDQEAGFTKKHGVSYHGYKMHTATDLSGIVTQVYISSARDHDSRHMDKLIEAEKRAVIADSAYSDGQRRQRLQRKGIIDAICYKRVRGQAALSPFQKRWNRVVSRIRAIGEHPYAWMKKLMHLGRCRYRGLRRNAFDLVMTAAAYNLRRSVSLAR